jgi:YbbR domain-containing protein
LNERARTWALRLLALGIAVGIWFNASVEDRLVSSEKVVEAGVSYNRPSRFIIINPVRSVNVRLSGSKKAVRQLKPDNVDVQVTLSQRQAPSTIINLGPENVLAPDGLEVVSIEPSTIRVDLEPEVSVRLPVVPRLVGTVVEEPEVFPNQVLVTGPESMLARVEALSTRPISIEGRATTLEEADVPVLTPDPLIQIVQPSKVMVRVPIKPPPRDQAKASAPKARKEKT